MEALALDMGGTHIGCAVVADREIIGTESIPSQNAGSLEALLPPIEKTLLRLLTEAKVNITECKGIAIGFPGIVETRTGNILSTLKKYDDAPRLNLSAWAKDTFGLPLRIENDARMALLGEQYAGAAVGYNDIVMITLGTGIGGAAMIHGRLLRGAHAQAGSLGGHLPLALHGDTCVCGNVGCAESEASGWSLPIIARRWENFSTSSIARLPEINFKELFAEAEKGDAVALQIRDHCLHVWAVNAVALVHAYDPEVIVIGGGVLRNQGYNIVASVFEYVTKHSWTPWGKVRCVGARLGENAALVGAIPLLQETL
jgi:glucokinase